MIDVATYVLKNGTARFYVASNYNEFHEDAYMRNIGYPHNSGPKIEASYLELLKCGYACFACSCAKNKKERRKING